LVQEWGEGGRVKTHGIFSAVNFCFGNVRHFRQRGKIVNIALGVNLERLIHLLPQESPMANSNRSQVLADGE
jgi:hypothetical protein